MKRDYNASNRAKEKISVLSVRTTQEQEDLFNRIMHDTGCGKTAAIEHLCDVYETALKIISTNMNK